MSEMDKDHLDDLQAFVVEENKMFGDTICLAPCEHNGMCSLDTGHTGFHISKGDNDRELCR